MSSEDDYLHRILAREAVDNGPSSPVREFKIINKGKPATAFLLELIARLQDIATVPMMDVRAYAKWLE